MDQYVDTRFSIKKLARETRSDLQYYHSEPAQVESNVKLVFIHGAFSSGWVWTPYFLPYFRELGFEAYAIDLRGRGSGSSYIPTTHGLSDYVSDVQDLLETIDGPYVLIGHSLGGIIAQKVSALAAPAGLALLASVPPEGLAVSGWQMAMANPLLFWNTAAFAMSPQLGNVGVTRDALLSPDVSDDIAKEMLRRSSPEAPRALMEAQLPLTYPPGFLASTPVCVFGADNDRLIPVSAIRRTGAFYGVEAHVFEDMAHALMVDTRWHLVADKLHRWLEADVV